MFTTNAGTIAQGNILVDAEGNCVISDFGISRIHDLEHSRTITGTKELKYSIFYAAIELLRDNEINVHNGHEFQTKETDIWAFAMVVYVCKNTAFLKQALTFDC
jgi:serine/threonine protein kinase